MLVCGLGAILSIAVAQLDLLFACFKAFLAVIFANAVHECYRHLYKHPERHSTHLTVIKVWSFNGSLIARREYGSIGRRFDCWAEREGPSPVMEGRINSLQCLIISVPVIAIFLFRVV